mmetsp:Transcript_124733/g.399628  ORF Transcript_124733/g.399628 Transcript_124733/m.399628 type:complete len:172 (+) Transcript_124733:3-518(+)
MSDPLAQEVFSSSTLPVALTPSARLAMATPRHLFTPVLTPLALQGRPIPWALETPSPSPSPSKMPTRMMSDPFHLSGAAIGTSPPESSRTFAASLAEALSTRALPVKVGSSAQKESPMDKFPPSAPALSRQRLRAICQPFFEQMLDAVEAYFMCGGVHIQMQTERAAAQTS